MRKLKYSHEIKTRKVYANLHSYSLRIINIKGLRKETKINCNAYSFCTEMTNNRRQYFYFVSHSLLFCTHTDNIIIFIRPTMRQESWCLLSFNYLCFAYFFIVCSATLHKNFYRSSFWYFVHIASSAQDCTKRTFLASTLLY